MTVLSPLEVLIALVLVAVIGGGGFTLGCMIGTDRAEQRQADELERRLALRAARRTPMAAQTYRPRMVAVAVEPDTMPMRIVPAITAALGHAVAAVTGRPQAGHGEHQGATSPAAMELAVSLATQRTELEIHDLIRCAEQAIGALTQEGTT